MSERQCKSGGVYEEGKIRGGWKRAYTNAVGRAITIGVWRKDNSRLDGRESGSQGDPCPIQNESYRIYF